MLRLDGTRRASVDGIMPPPDVTLTFDPRSNHYVPGQGTYTWPNFAEISWNIADDIVFTRFFGLLTPVTLTFDPKS